MPFPNGVETVTVTAGAAGYRTLDGDPYTGTITFTPSVSRVTSATHGIIALGPVNATLSASGQFTETLLATDADDFTPTGWTYRVDEEFTNAPGRAYNISLPAATPTVALPALSPVESSSGTVSSPAVLSVNGETGVVTIDAADVGAVPTARQVIAGTGLTGGGALTADRTLTVSFGTTGTTVCVGNDARLSDARTPTTHAATHSSAGSDPLALAQSQVTGLTAALAALLPLTGGTLTGNLTINGADLAITGTGKGYRFRRGGGALDLEATGSDLLLSNWSGPNFDGTQRSYARLSADALNTQWAGKFESVGALYGGAVHTLDPTTGVASVGGKNGLTAIRLAGFKDSAGAPAAGTWATGDVVLDSAGGWHLCSAGGSPGTWT
ncbi:hypothetical protein [Streptomyces ipomoeae]|uniref:hypothetical protein n=1 Tax=Streptomyces ipomoeae TaxID=103232 RepID=UPI0029A2BBDE|nr:hypothetical protein [Streptomyces ipomoeae]MDX2697111.1 hypothetical protein [Streptomyces ipomoeae]